MGRSSSLAAAYRITLALLCCGCAGDGNGRSDAAALLDGGRDLGDACASPCLDAGESPDSGESEADAAPRDAASESDAAAHVDCQSFPVFARDCDVAADCTLGTRVYNCCGSTLVTGLRVDQLAAFNRAASQCSATFPACGCATEPTRADDGSQDQLINSSLPKVTCHQGQCWSSFTQFAGKTPCGLQGKTCDAATQVCRQRTPFGPAVVFDCVPVSAACAARRGCECLADQLCTEDYDLCSEGTFANNVTCTCPTCQ